MSADKEKPLNEQHILTSKNIVDICREIDTNITIDNDCQDILMQLSDDIFNQIVVSSCKLSNLRRSKTLDLKDVQLCLEKFWDINIPGFLSESVDKVKLSKINSFKNKFSSLKKR